MLAHPTAQPTPTAQPIHTPPASPRLPPGIAASPAFPTARPPHLVAPANDDGSPGSFLAEVEAAAQFVVDLVARTIQGTIRLNPRLNPRRQAPPPSAVAAAALSETELSSLRAGLVSSLSDHLTGHWYPAQPSRGSGFRCLSLADGRVDRAFVVAVERAGLSRSRARAHTVTVCAMRAISAKAELRVFVDPGSVAVRRADGPPFYLLGGPALRRSHGAAGAATIPSIAPPQLAGPSPPPSPRSLSPSAPVFAPVAVAGAAPTCTPIGAMMVGAGVVPPVTAGRTASLQSPLPATLPPLQYTPLPETSHGVSRSVSGPPAPASAIRAGMLFASSWTSWTPAAHMVGSAVPTPMSAVGLTL